MHRYEQPLRVGSTHVVLEPLDFMFSINGMPRAVLAVLARLD